MSARTLPRHSRTGMLALGYRKARPAAGEDPLQRYPIWPIRGGAEGDDSGDTDDGDQDDDADESDTDDKGDGDTVDHKADAEKWKAQARKHETRAKENAAAAKELARIKREGMSDIDKKVDEAVAAARAEERTKAGERVAKSAFLAAAKGRLDKAKEVLDDINLRRYVNDDGEVDDDAIAELVDKLAPKKSDKDDDQGDERDTRRRTRSGGYQGTRQRGSNGGNGGGSSLAEGAELYKTLLGRGNKT
ncbi:hypothetical protein ACFVZR_02190 [Streptomyces sp. NPDC058316]|uniref:hypothetical protein n=1 Tax=Streptomyces sp. NPDC058316 TaxID=3346442 RepID=UPI0036E83CA5